MRNLKLLVILGLGLLVAQYAHAQGGPDPNYDPGYVDPGQSYGNPYGAPVYVGPPPVCPYGYYDYYPYACAPYGFYGPGWFSSGVFIGVGPWGRGYRGFYGGRAFGGRGYYGNGRGFSGRGGFRGGVGNGRAFSGGARGFSGGGHTYGGGGARGFSGGGHASGGGGRSFSGGGGRGGSHGGGRR